MPGTLTAHPVAHTPDLISAAADGPVIWVHTASTLIRLQLGAPHATHSARVQVAGRQPLWLEAGRQAVHVGDGDGEGRVAFAAQW